MIQIKVNKFKNELKNILIKKYPSQTLKIKNIFELINQKYIIIDEDNIMTEDEFFNYVIINNTSSIPPNILYLTDMDYIKIYYILIGCNKYSTKIISIDDPKEYEIFDDFCLNYNIKIDKSLYEQFENNYSNMIFIMINDLSFAASNLIYLEFFNKIKTIDIKSYIRINKIKKIL